MLVIHTGSTTVDYLVVAGGGGGGTQGWRVVELEDLENQFFSSCMDG
jgi:hypothetical protein